jgi:hypothetical protein
MAGAKRVVDARLHDGLGVDRDYDTREFFEPLAQMKLPPRVAQKVRDRQPAVSICAARYGGYAMSRQKRELIEKGFGWITLILSNSLGNGPFVEARSPAVRCRPETSRACSP